MGVAFFSTFINLAAFVAACTFLSGPSRSALLTEEDLGEVELNRGVDTARSALAKKTITGESLKISRSTTVRGWGPGWARCCRWLVRAGWQVLPCSAPDVLSSSLGRLASCVRKSDAG